MHRILVFFAWVALMALFSAAAVSAQKEDTILELLMKAIDDTSCGDAIGRTYRGATFIAAYKQNDMDDFFARHESCAGSSGATAALGRTPLPIGLTSRCSAPVEFPDLEYEWVICALGFTAKEDLTTPVHIELDEFYLIADDDQKLASYPYPDLYAGQRNDMIGGLDFAGPDPVFGTIAFPAFPGQVDGPFVIWWETTGDSIIADELEPNVAEAFIHDMQQR